MPDETRASDPTGFSSASSTGDAGSAFSSGVEKPLSDSRELRTAKEIYQAGQTTFDDILALNNAMRQCLATARQAADTDLSILILGENGTGKTLFARAIHNASRRARESFVSFNCSALQETLLEAELFGHEKGAFTGAVNRHRGKFEQADKGTLFLDEIGDLSLGAQAKLLRAIEYGEIERVGGEETLRVNVRLLAATNKDILELIESGLFRRDLYYRLNDIQVTLPPLRNRREDLEILIAHLVRVYGERYGRPVKGVSQAALELLRRHDWPGNVRELETVIKRAVALSGRETLWIEDLAFDINLSLKEEVREKGTDADDWSLSTCERRHIERVLKHTGYNKKETSRLLDIARTTLDRKLRQYGLE